jgi:flagella basal body P-ring formation protein FlgA
MTVTRSLLALLLCICAAAAAARQDPAPVHAAVERFLALQTQSLAGEVRIEAGELGSDNALSPCTRIEAFLPPGTRPWGRISVGVRCLAPAPWSAYIPAQVRVSGPYLVTTRPLASGQPISPDDLRSEVGELTAQSADLLTDSSQAVGHALRVAVAAGKPLTASLLRQLAVVVQGQAVKVVSRGPGFEVTTDGMALSSAADGQAAQVRLSGGQVLRGTARAGGYVEISLP